MARKVRYYRVYLDGNELGSVKDDSLRLQFNNKIVRLEDVSGYIGTADAKSYGIIPRLTLNVYDSDTATLWGTILEDYTTVITSGSDKAYHAGTILIDLLANAKTLLLHPGDLDSTNRAEDITFHLASINPEGLELAGSMDKFQEIALNIEIFPDESRDDYTRYFIIGDPTITNTPLAVWIQANRRVNTPADQATVFTLAAGCNEYFQAWALFGDIVTTATGAINDAANITATTTSIVYDTMAGGAFVSGKYYKIESEYIYVTAVATSSSVAGTLTAVRGVCGTTAAGHNDDVVITMVTGQSLERQTDQATWASSDDTKATVGNTYQGTGTANKGVIAHVAAGSTNITATLNSVASANLAITAS